MLTDPSAANPVAVQISDPDLDADVRAVLAALSLTAHPLHGGIADVLVTDHDPRVTDRDPHATDGPVGLLAATVIRVAGDGAPGDDDEVVRLPSGTARLVELLTTPRPGATGRLVVVVGAVGGCGATTLAAAMAVRAAEHSRTLLLEADPHGTGIDLVLGLEAEPGLRVDDVRCDLGGPDPGALWAAVPLLTPDCGVLARSRTAETARSGSALARRGLGDTVVCDAGGPHADRDLLARADHLVVVTRADLPGALAAARFAPARGRASLVVRTQRGDPLHPGDVGDAAGFPSPHAVPEFASVRRSAGSGELGRSLTRGRGGRLRGLVRVADAVLAEVGGHEW